MPLTRTQLREILLRPQVGLWLAVLGVVALTAIRFSVEPLAQSRAAFSFFFPWVMVVAWWWGARVGLVACVLSIALVAYFILQPRGSFGLTNPPDRVATLFNAATMFACVWIGSRGRRAWLIRAQALEFAGKLAVAEVRRTAVFSAALDCIIIMDASGIVTDWNSAAEHTFGYSREEAMGRSVAELIIPPKYREAHHAGLRRCLETTGLTGPVIGRRVELTALRRSGEEFPVELAISGARLPSGEAFFTANLRDISESAAARARLADSETQLRLMTDAVPALIAYIDTDRRYRFANKAFTDWFGLTSAQVIGHTMDEVLGSEAAALLRPHVARALSGRVDHFEILLPYSRGGSRWVEGHYLPRLDASGAVVGLYAMVVDITLRKKAEERRAEVETRFRATFDNAAVGIAHVSPLGRWLRVNDWLCRTLGYSRDELLGLTFGDITHPDDLTADMDRMNRTLRGEIPSYSLEKRYIRKDGTVLHSELTVSLVRADDGEPEYFISIVQDVTSRRTAEQALKGSEGRFRDLADNIAALAWMADEKGWISWYNRRWFEYTGTTPESMEGWGWKSVHDPEHLGHVMESWNHALNTQTPWEDLFPLRRADGEFRWFLSRAHPIRDDSGRVVRWFGTNTDVTEQREAEQLLRQTAAELTEHKDRLEELVVERTLALEQSYDQLRRNERMASLGTFAAGLGHDLHNSLLPLRVHVQELAKAAGELPRIGESVHAIESIVGYLGSLSRGMRLFSRDINQDTDRGYTNLDEWKQDACRFFQSSVPREVRVTCEVAPGTPSIEVAPHRLSQTILNLVINAGDAIAAARAPGTPRGSIAITAVPAGEKEVAIRVHDDGCGMSPEVARRCLEPYFTTKARGQGGTGMGLAMVFGIVSNAGGRVEVESTPGQGTTFVLTLPAATTETDAGARLPAHVTIANQRIAAFVNVVVDALKMETVDRAPAADETPPLWITDPQAATPQAVRAFMAANPGSRVIVVGGDGQYVETGAETTPPTALSRLRTVILDAAHATRP